MSAKPISSNRALEPFGQAGVRQFLIPVASLVLLFIACFSAVMWSRSYDTSDLIGRRIGISNWSIYSIWGRIIIMRTDYRTAVDPVSLGDTGWQYGSQPVPEGMQD